MKDTKTTIGLMSVCLINNILYMFLNTFMVAYFIKLTNYNYKQISIYYIISFIFIMITAIILGPKVKSKNQLSIFRIGIILHCFYILILALLKESIINYYIYLGAFYGIVQAFFWSAGHTLIEKHIGRNSDKFISTKSMIDKIFKILFPIVFGVSIEFTSFTHVAKLVVLLSIVSLLFSLLIKKSTTQNSTKYSLKKFYSNYKNNKQLKNYYKMICCDGIVSYLLDTLITIIIIITFKTTISLGFLTTIFAISSIISIYIYQNKIKNKEKALKFSSIAMALSVLLILLNISKTTVSIYNLCAGTFLILLRNTAQARRYTMLNNNKKIEKEYLVEHQVLSEIYLNISRIIGYITLFITSIFNNLILFKILLIITTIIIVIYSNLLITLINKERGE